MDHFTRLIEQLPPDRRVEAALVLENLSNDPNSVSYAIYSEILHALNVKFAERLAATDAKIFQLAFEQAKSQSVIQNAIQTESRNLSGDKPWKRGITKSIVNGLVWLISVAAGSMAILLILFKTEISPLKKVIADYQTIAKHLSDDPASLVAYAQYSKEVCSESLDTAMSLHAISKIMTMPKMQLYRGEDGFLIIAGDANTMPVGTFEDGRNWIKLANPVARFSSDTTPAIDEAKKAQKKVELSK